MNLTILVFEFLFDVFLQFLKCWRMYLKFDGSDFSFLSNFHEFDEFGKFVLNAFLYIIVHIETFQRNCTFNFPSI